MKTVLVSAPVYQREWILTYYLRILKEQKFDGKLEFAFVDGGSTDNTVRILSDFGAEVVKSKLISGNTTVRNWNVERLRFITQVKNEVIELARAKQPDFLFCIDTDILLQGPDCIQKLVNDDKDIVGPYFRTGSLETHPNIMKFNGTTAQHFRKNNVPAELLFKVDVIFGAILITKECFNIAKFEFDFQGEEIGFARLSFRLGFDSWCDSRVNARHVWSEKHLETVRRDYGL
jgi:glycosyltransferase involved in cell wall biosynthesis